MTKPAAIASCLLLLLFLAPFSEAQQTAMPTLPENGYKIPAKKTKPSATLIVIVLVCAFCLIGLSAFAVRHCSVDHSAPIPINPRISADGGLDPDLIETFPIIMYSEVKDLKIGSVPLQCAVCLNEFQDDESLRILPRCDHVFHPECIDIWLATNITCPVCRTDLAREDDEVDGALAHAPPIGEPSAKSELGEEKKQVSINVPGDPTVEIVQINQQSKQNRPPRSKSTRTGIPRSHSTGHSLVQPGENLDRFTLRLPEEVKNQIAINSRLNRVRSNGAGLPRVRSERTGFRSGSSSTGIGYLSRGSGRFDRMAKSDRGWVFTLAPPFLSRGNSVRSPNNLTGDGVNEKTYLTSPLRSPLNFGTKVDGVENFGTKVDGVENSSARPQV